jgi:carotenoid 1,2-hydratase
MDEALTLPPWPDTPSHYRWLYADVCAGEYSAVFIFMSGALFSPHYARRAGRGASPLEHCAVNFALYRNGKPVSWAFSEYGCERTTSDDTLTIGRSTWRYDRERIVIDVDERSVLWGRPVRASLVLVPLCAPADPVRLHPDLPHEWRALAARCDAELTIDGIRFRGLGYHDTNHGEELLGERLHAWRWARVHDEKTTWISYDVPGTDAISVIASAHSVSVTRAPLAASVDRKTAWRLAVPRTISVGGHQIAATSALESSPFYARLEGREGNLHGLVEVADFARFLRPSIRWMARMRLRRRV